MLDDLNQIRKRLGISPSGILVNDDVSFLERHMLGLKVVLGKTTYQENLDSIDRANSFLRQTTTQSLNLEASRLKRRSKQVARAIKAIQNQATSLYNVMVKGACWTCSCKESHVASLQLETRSYDVVRSPLFRLRILLFAVDSGAESSSSEWRDVEVEVEMETVETIKRESIARQRKKQSGSPAKAEKKGVKFNEPSLNQLSKISCAVESYESGMASISDICRFMHNCLPAKHKMGVLVDADSITDVNFRHKLHISRSQAGHSLHTRSLEDILRTSHLHRNWLGKGDRLQIAVDIASSVLQLASTPWLKPDWRSQDITLHELDEHSHVQAAPVASKPYLSWPLNQINEGPVPLSTSPMHLRPRHIRNEGLLYLAFALIELSLSKTLDDLGIDEDQNSNEITTRLNTAIRSLDQVYIASGDRYGDVVQRCLHCTFDMRDVSFSNEDFQQVVYEKVVCPLADDLRVFRDLGK